MAAVNKTKFCFAEKCVLYVYDLRKNCLNTKENIVDVSACQSFDELYDRILKCLKIDNRGKNVLCTTSRVTITAENFEYLEDGDTLYFMNNETNAELDGQVKEYIRFQPHYDTIIKGGLYEYYASEGQNPIPFAFAELIDNALSATSSNVGLRKIDIIMYLDAEPTIIVTDNGRGMTAKMLNNWAIYRLSKFNRRDSQIQNIPEGQSQLSPDTPYRQDERILSRCLSSDISYFGVGGKQAIFFIGSYTKIITKSCQSPDVHELEISKEGFERKEKENESIYSGFIINRKSGDASHVSSDDIIQQKLIGDEKGKQSFTAVIIRNIGSEHLSYMRTQLRECCKQLAHIYHYYLHGPAGNVVKDLSFPRPDAIVDISITVYDRAARVPRVYNLCDIDTDLETQYIRSAASTFEFKAIVDGGYVEGILRYHPFLYDHETYPSESSMLQETDASIDEHDYALNEGRPARGKRPIFECFWNGRLIPYTFISEFDWCVMPKKYRTLPAECYNRVSGTLFTNQTFQVSTNKLTFMDLELKMKSKNTVYSLIVDNTEKRVDIAREFHTWLKSCHENFDKQVKFSHFKNVIERSDLSKKVQSPWSVFEQIEWDGRVFKKGTLIHVLKTTPAFYGSIEHFVLFGDYHEDIFATGGEMLVRQEPRFIYEESKYFPLTKLDRAMTVSQIKNILDDEEARLPSSVEVKWPEGNSVVEGAKLIAGSHLGPLEIKIRNKREEEINKVPGTRKKLMIELKLVWHSKTGDEVLAHHISQHGSVWPYWFYQMDNLKNIGNHSLVLQAIVNDTDNKFAGRELPCLRINFSVIEAPAEKFSVGLLEGPFRIGVGFNIPLDFQDAYGHPTRPLTGIQPVLEASGLDLKYKETIAKGNSLIIKDIVALGVVDPSGGKSFTLHVSIRELKESKQQMKIRLLPGPPVKLVVTPENLAIENGSSLKFNVEVKDEAGNITLQPKLVVICHFTLDNDTDHVYNFPEYKLDCSNIGQGILSGPAIWLTKVRDIQKIKALITLQDVKNVACIERIVTVLPSHQPSFINVSYEKDSKKVDISEGEEMLFTAGENVTALKYAIFDESGVRMEITDDLASKLKVNWVAKNSKETLMKGILPDIKVPSLAGDTKYCNISLHHGLGIEFQFTIRVSPGEPAQIKCKYNGPNRVRLTEPLQGDIIVLVQDKFGNNVSKFEKGVLRDLEISGEGLLVEETFRMLGPVSGFNISGVRFTSGAIGNRELKVKWREFLDFVRLEVIAGPPAKITLPGWDVSQPLTVTNGSVLPQEILYQLCDDQSNPTAESNVKMQLFCDSQIKLSPRPNLIMTDSKGIANFGSFLIQAKKGVYEIICKAFLSRRTIVGPSITVNVVPDLQRPKELLVSFTPASSYIVGGTFPDISVMVLAEEQSPVQNAKASGLHLNLKYVSLHSKTACSNVLLPDKNTQNCSDGMFTFSNRKIPAVAGDYEVTFIYKDTFKGELIEIKSSPVTFSVQAGQPSRLYSAKNIPMPTVTNETNSASRIVVNKLVLEMQDDFGNVAGKDFQGIANLSIHCRDPSVTDLPALAGNTDQYSIPVKEGLVTFDKVQLAPNTPGKDSQEYVLRCIVSCIGRQQSCLQYDLPFIFCNSAKKMAEVAKLTNERNVLKNAVVAYKSIIETSNRLIDELRARALIAHKEIVKQQESLRLHGIGSHTLYPITNIDKLIKTKSAQKEQLEESPRRTCGLAKAPDEADVLGKVAHLATVADDDVARVLSWHMHDDMDCIITKTSKKARDLFDRSRGKQQVLPLDSIFTKRLPEWDKPLIHEIMHINFQPTGHPVYARRLLQFDRFYDECKIVFGMLLGDTLIVDTLDDANAYRQEIVKKSHCPTILTRTGERIKSIGKFGGGSNQAVSWDKLNGAYFSAPVPQLYKETCEVIDQLNQLRNMVLKEEDLKDELQIELNKQKTPEVQAKLKELQDTEKKLRETEIKLGMTPQTSRSQVSITPETSASHQNPSTLPQTVTSHKRGRKRRIEENTKEEILSKQDNNTSLHLPVEASTPTRSSHRKVHPTAKAAEYSLKKSRKST